MNDAVYVYGDFEFCHFRSSMPITEALCEKINKFHLADWYKWKNETLPSTAQVDWNSVRAEMPKDVTVHIPKSFCPWKATMSKIIAWYPGELEEMPDNPDFLVWLIFFMQVYLIPNGIRISGSGTWETLDSRGGCFYVASDYTISLRGKFRDSDALDVNAHNLYAREYIKSEKRKRFEIERIKDPKRYFVNPFTSKCKEVPREDVDGFVAVRKSVFERLQCSASAVKEVDSFIATCGIDKVYTFWIKYYKEIKEKTVRVTDGFGYSDYVTHYYQDEADRGSGVFFYRHGFMSTLQADNGKLEVVRYDEFNGYDVSLRDEMKLSQCRSMLLRLLIPAFLADVDVLSEELAGYRFYDTHLVRDCNGVCYRPKNQGYPLSRVINERLLFEVCDPVASLREISFDEYQKQLYK